MNKYKKILESNGDHWYSVLITRRNSVNTPKLQPWPTWPVKSFSSDGEAYSKAVEYCLKLDRSLYMIELKEYRYIGGKGIRVCRNWVF